MASVSLVMVVKQNFSNRDFVIDQKFSMGLRSAEFPDQSNIIYALCGGQEMAVHENK